MKTVTLRDGSAERRLLLVHGFMGSPYDWDAFVKACPAGSRIDAVVLPGHGSQPEAVGHFESAADALADFFSKKSPPETLIGYSLGGRLALAAACRIFVKNLVLVSSTAGLQDNDERRQRTGADAKLAKKLAVSKSPEAFQKFLRSWWGQPLFASLGGHPDILKKLFSDRLEHSSESLAEVLEKWSSGRQEPLWEKLPDLKSRVYFLAGEKDQKYTELAKKMAALCSGGDYKIFPDVGHSLHVEAPQKLADFLKIIFSG
ncbi:MAG: alpha/beta fold hydrolase [Chthoniobacterales bacterium]